MVVVRSIRDGCASQVEDLACTVDAVVDESVVHWQVLAHDELAGFLRGDSAEE